MLGRCRPRGPLAAGVATRTSTPARRQQEAAIAASVLAGVHSHGFFADRSRSWDTFAFIGLQRKIRVAWTRKRERHSTDCADEPYCFRLPTARHFFSASGNGRDVSLRRQPSRQRPDH